MKTFATILSLSVFSHVVQTEISSYDAVAELTNAATVEQELYFQILPKE